MTLFGVLGFASPWLLVGLLALPVLWVLLRAVPPSPSRRIFPAVTLLLGLKDDEQISDRTPWWLLLLRMLAVAAVIIGLAGPVLNPDRNAGSDGDTPLLVVMDASWASAPDWARRIETLRRVLTDAQRAERPVALLSLTSGELTPFQGADTVASRLTGLEPLPWEPQTGPDLPDGAFDSYWMSDGLDRESRSALLTRLQERGTVTVFQSAAPVMVLHPPQLDDGRLTVTARRVEGRGPVDLTITAQGTDPAGNPATLAEMPARFEGDALTAEAVFDLPSEMRARITRFEIAGRSGAGAVTLADDSLRRREVALLTSRAGREGLELLSPRHYLTKAFAPNADLIDGALLDILPANPDVIVFADVATVAPAEKAALLDWLEKGGVLLRFAGPNLAASDISRTDEDPLMPVRLRAGGRTIGGAMSWGEPKSLAPFVTGSPFFGLSVPEDVTVSAQVMAQPDPSLSERVIAQLSDGTPLVTRKPVGQGQVVLFHVTANAEWSSLALSGLFVQMLERVAVSAMPHDQEPEALAGTIWQPVSVLDGFGRLRDAGTLAGVAGELLFTDPVGPALHPGLYQSDRMVAARNVATEETLLSAAVWPRDVDVTGFVQAEEKPLGGGLLALAIGLLSVDVVASLALAGRLGMAGAAMIALVAMGLPQSGQAQDDSAAVALSSEVHLAHVITGNPEVDRLARAGLAGLSETLFFRTSIEPDEPVGIDLETDELAFYPMLYWPITPDQPTPSAEAYVRLNAYLRTGGMILFDTRDSDIAGFGTASPNGRKLRSLAAPLDIPPLEPVPEDHVLTRTFYLLNEFPGRHAEGAIWVEAAPPDAELIEGMPFRNLNDNVTPVVIGGNDWASAWAMDERGNALVPVGRGFAGERQREIAFRFGVNLVMHVLTGNYKSDQVHVPALLERLGQ